MPSFSQVCAVQTSDGLHKMFASTQDHEFVQGPFRDVANCELRPNTDNDPDHYQTLITCSLCVIVDIFLEMSSKSVHKVSICCFESKQGHAAIYI